MDNTAYLVQSFNKLVLDGQRAIATEAGIFVIDQPAVLRWIEARRPGERYAREVIEDYARSAFLEPKQFVEYLIETIELLSPVKGAVAPTVRIISDDNRILEWFSEAPFSGAVEILDDIPSIDNSNQHRQVLVGIFFDYPSRVTLTNFAEVARRHRASTIVTRLNSTVYIDGLWLPERRTPCHFCHRDFFFERVFFDPNSSPSSLWDLYENLTEDNFRASQKLPLMMDDLMFIARHIRQYVEAALGQGRDSGYGSFHPLYASKIDLRTLRIKQLRVPLSPLCSCIREQLTYEASDTKEVSDA